MLDGASPGTEDRIAHLRRKEAKRAVRVVECSKTE